MKADGFARPMPFGQPFGTGEVEGIADNDDLFGIVQQGRAEGDVFVVLSERGSMRILSAGTPMDTAISRMASASLLPSPSVPPLISSPPAKPCLYRVTPASTRERRQGLGAPLRFTELPKTTAMSAGVGFSDGLLSALSAQRCSCASAAAQPVRKTMAESISRRFIGSAFVGFRAGHDSTRPGRSGLSGRMHSAIIAAALEGVAVRAAFQLPPEPVSTYLPAIAAWCGYLLQPKTGKT